MDTPEVAREEVFTTSNDSGRPVRQKKKNSRYEDANFISGGSPEKAKMTKGRPLGDLCQSQIKEEGKVQVGPKRRKGDEEERSMLIHKTKSGVRTKNVGRRNPSPAVASTSTGSTSSTSSSTDVSRSRVKEKPSPTALYKLPSGFIGPQSPLSHSNEIEMDLHSRRKIIIRLRNMLRILQTFTWVYYEFFYSDIDQVLFGGENDFQRRLPKALKDLAPRKMTRAEWTFTRRRMGKPRRWSRALLVEERLNLMQKREMVRMLQRGKLSTNVDCSSLPDEIPLRLTIGAKVSARLRQPRNGIFFGVVEGMDPSDNSYRINFQRAEIGIQSVVDYEVVSHDPPQMISTSSKIMKISTPCPPQPTDHCTFQNAFLLGKDGRFLSLPNSQFPLQFLITLVGLSKLLKSKRERISQLKELNAEGEKILAFSQSFDQDYRIKYARCIVDMEGINKQISEHISRVKSQVGLGIPDDTSSPIIFPEDVRKKCNQEANLIVESCNTKEENPKVVTNLNTLTLISKLSSSLLQMKMLSGGDRRPHEVTSIKDTMKDIKASLTHTNLQLFQEKIEMPMNRIQAGLCVPNPTAKF